MPLLEHEDGAPSMQRHACGPTLAHHKGIQLVLDLLHLIGLDGLVIDASQEPFQVVDMVLIDIERATDRGGAQMGKRDRLIWDGFNGPPRWRDMYSSSIYLPPNDSSSSCFLPCIER